MKKTSFSQARPTKHDGQKWRVAKTRNFYTSPASFQLGRMVGALRAYEGQLTLPHMTGSEWSPPQKRMEAEKPEVETRSPSASLNETQRVEALLGLQKIEADLNTTEDKANWNMLSALAAVDETRQVAARLQTKLDQAPVEIDKSEPQEGAWLPSLKSLFGAEPEAGRSWDSRALVANLSHYVQFCNVGLEQIIYDQSVDPVPSSGPDFITDLKVIEGTANRLTCNFELVIKDLDVLTRMSARLGRLANRFQLNDEPEGSPLRTKLGQLRDRFARLQYLGQAVESAFWRRQASFVNLAPGKARLLVFVGRDVMPIKARKLSSMGARLGRDHHLLSCYIRFGEFFDEQMRKLYRFSGP